MHAHVCSKFPGLPADSKPAEKLVAQGFRLGDGAKAPVVDFLSVKLDAVLRELETLLNNGCQFPNSSSLLT